MALMMDGLLMAATVFAGGYCWILARRVNDLKSLDKGLGGAIVTLTRQIELARTTLDEARAASSGTKEELSALIARADAAAGQLRMVVATSRDLEALHPVRRDPPAATRTSESEKPARELARPRVGKTEASDDPPKPRTLPRLEQPLRTLKPRSGARSEDEILAALSAMAGKAS